MRRSLSLLALLAVAVLVAACSSSTAPGWTYAAPTSPPPSQPAASGSGRARVSRRPPGGVGIGAVQISALNIAFEQKEVTAPADAPFMIHFNNKDAGLHNVDDQGRERRRACSRATSSPAPARPTTRSRRCPPALPVRVHVHANMTGTITAG